MFHQFFVGFTFATRTTQKHGAGGEEHGKHAERPTFAWAQSERPGRLTRLQLRRRLYVYTHAFTHQLLALTLPPPPLYSVLQPQRKPANPAKRKANTRRKSASDATTRYSVPNTYPCRPAANRRRCQIGRCSSGRPPRTFPKANVSCAVLDVSGTEQY